MYIDKEFQELAEYNGDGTLFKDKMIAKAVREQVSQPEVEAAFRKSVVALFEEVAKIHPEIKNLDIYREMQELNSRIEAIKSDVKSTINLGG